MKLNKLESTQRILEMGKHVHCRKSAMNNIVFPKWSDLGLVGMMFRQCVSTKEQPLGYIYDEAKFQTVLRIINGKVLMTGRPDCYCWSFSKITSSKNVSVIGTNSATGIINMCNVITSISSEDEKKMVADMFASLNKDLLLVHTELEERTCIQVTPELYKAGITACVDEWMDTDENGCATPTLLSIGDYLIVSESGVYCIRQEEFEQTHTI